MLHLLIWLVVISAVFAILRLVVPWVLGQIGVVLGEGAAMVMQVLKIILWAVVVIYALIIVFQLLSCFLGMPWRL